MFSSCWGFFSDSAFRPRHVVFGQYIGIAVLYVVSVVAALIALVISPVYVGMLGIAPIAIGARKLWNFRLERTETESERNLSGQTPRRVVAVAAVTLANGGDNLGTYIPVFATRTLSEITFIGAVFLIMTAIWLVVAHWLVNHRTLGFPIRRYGHRIVPFVLIGLGILVLQAAGTFKVLIPRIASGFL